MIKLISSAKSKPKPVSPRNLVVGKVYKFVYTMSEEPVFGIAVNTHNGKRFLELVNHRSSEEVAHTWGPLTGFFSGEFYLAKEGISIKN